MVGGVHYRHPGLWVKAATTLDVLSGGRAWLGIGAAWNQEESDALGFPMPPLATRFELLEETLRIARAMWTGERGTEERFEGAHYTAGRLLNAPQSLSRPRVPIMIGGGGEQKTLRLVAQYADASNVFGGADTLRRKYAILRAHCERVGRPYEEIERSNLQSTGSRRGPPRARRRRRGGRAFAALAEAGAQHVIVGSRKSSSQVSRPWRRASSSSPTGLPRRRIATDGSPIAATAYCQASRSSSAGRVDRRGIPADVAAGVAQEPPLVSRSTPSAPSRARARRPWR